MESKKINQLATEMSPAISDLTIIGDPITGVSKKITLLQIADLFQTTGTVTSVAVTESGNALNITGSPITTAGTINIGFAGSANQYVRGDGALAPFPTSTGGGSSVSYYLNGSVNQGTFGGSTYYQMSKNAIVGTGTNFSISSNGLIAQFITDANDPDVVQIPSGNWNIEFFMNVSASSGALASFYVEFYKYNGSTFTLLATNSATPEELTNTTTVDAYYTSVAMPTSALSITDRLAIRIYANVASKTVTLYTEDNRLCQVVTTFSKGMLSLNNLTDQSQYLTTGTSGTNFAIVSSGDTHTFNLPVASATNTGKLSSTDWSTFNNKLSTATAAATYVPYTGATTSVDLGFNNFDANQINGFKIVAKLDGTSSGSLILRTGTSGYSYGNDSISLISSPTSANTLTIISDISSVAKIAQIGLGSLTATRTFTLPDASGTLALTSNIPSVSGTSTYIPVFTGTNSLGNSQIWNNGGIIGMGTNYSNPAFYVVASSGDTLTQGKLAINTTSFSGTSVLQVNGAATLTGNLTGTTAAFSSFVNAFSFTAIGGTSNAGQISLKHTGAISVGDGYVTIAADSSNTLGIYFFNSFSAKFSISALTNNRTYTLPDGTGTLALTSNLSSYLPLTGGTLTGPLSGTSATFSGDLLVGLTSSSFQVANRNVVVVNGTSSALYGLVIGGVNKGYIYSDATSVRLMSLDASGFMSFGTNNTERMHINSSGNVGIGTSSPFAVATGARVLQVDGSAYGFILASSGSVIGQFAGNSGGIVTFGARSNHDVTFTTNDVERMRLTTIGPGTIGCLLVNKTTSSVSYPIQTQSANGAYMASASGPGDANFYSTSPTIGYHIYGDQGGAAKFNVTGAGKGYFAAGVQFGNGSGTLNYYEEGNWTPQLAFDSGTYVMGGINSGRYVRVGNLVHLQFQMQWSSINGSAGGTLKVNGVPFSAGGTCRSAGTICANNSIILGSGYTWLGMTIDPGASFIYIIQNAQSGGYSHGPSVNSSGVVYSLTITYSIT